MSGSGRDLAWTRQRLQAWLAERLGDAEAEVSPLSVPKAGVSNETYLGCVRWVDRQAGRRSQAFVLRIEPSERNLFVQPDVLREARVLRALAGQGAPPVPAVLFEEADVEPLGAPFYVMARVEGRVPSDVPSWHQRGWTTELSPEAQGLLYDNALVALGRLHHVDWTDGLRFLGPSGPGSALDHYLAHLQRWAEWCDPYRRFDDGLIDRALAYVLEHRPAVADTVVTWGDARVGNIVFTDDLEVAALLDWEGATLGPPELDVGWWLMFEEFLCEAQGLQRLPGVPDRQRTIERYQELTGRSLVAIGYFEVVAGLVLTMINTRLAHLLIAGGRVDPGVAAEYVTRVAAMTQRRMDEEV